MVRCLSAVCAIFCAGSAVAGPHDPATFFPDSVVAYAEITRPAEAVKQLPRLERLPQRVDELLGQATAGRLRMRLSMFSDPHDTDTLSTLVNRVVLAMISSALGLGSTILLHASPQGERPAQVTIHEVLGYVGLGIAAVLMLRVISSIVRDGRS